MNKLELLRELRHHLRLSEKRNPAFDQNRIGKALGWVMAIVMSLYLMFIAVALSLIVNNSFNMTGYEFMYSLMPFILIVDFLSRFVFQQTPMQLVKPYTLLPISKYTCIDCFLVNSVLSSYNFLWFALFVPFTLMSIFFCEGVFVSAAFLVGLYLLMIANSQWYLLARSLINTHMAWWGLPVFVYALLFSPIYIGKDAGFVQFFDFYAHTGEGFSFGNPLYYIGIITIIVSLLLLNRKIQHLFVWKELGKTETSSQRNIIKLEFLDRTGEISEYLKLEVKSILRNKNIKKGFISGTILILIFSLLLSFSTIYDGKYMSYFWCVYCFAIYGALLLVKIMCYEGNYIDALMVHKENIISLLRAKYYFYSILLVIPFVLMLPTVYMGKCTLMMLVSYALFTAGVDYFLFFQMAVFNKQSMPLNTKFIGKGSMENNWIQVGIQSFIFTFPWIYISILQLLLSDTLSYIIISLTGLAFIVTHPIWLQNIYRRMMVHRYENMEGFRNSR